jgi:hypothetical protein
MDNPEPWFAPKRYGCGAGWPITWQGWAVLGGYLTILAVVAWLDDQVDHRVRALGLGVFLAITATFLSVIHRRTKGGWKWRWGTDD